MHLGNRSKLIAVTQFIFSSVRDAFDTLFDHAPEKLIIVKRSLIEFANRHLEKLNLSVTDLDTQVRENYFIGNLICTVF